MIFLQNRCLNVRLKSSALYSSPFAQLAEDNKIDLKGSLRI